MSALEQKITLITGSTKGIGAAIASAFVDKQAQVVVHGRDREEAQAVKESIGAYSSVYGDLGTAEGCGAVLELSLIHI